EKRIRVAERKDLAGTTISTGFHPRERARVAAQFDCLRQVMAVAEDVRRSGSAALDLAYVAAGRSDGYFVAGVQAWDIAAGMLLVRAAGDKVCDFKIASMGPVHVPMLGRKIVAGNIRVDEALQKTIVASGYAAAFYAAVPRGCHHPPLRGYFPRKRGKMPEGQ